MDLNITQSEMLNIIVATEVWANSWQNRKVEIKCDNLAVVEVMFNIQLVVIFQEKIII